ncbi:MAG: type II secretion system protein GspJ [Candidatus Omnitrophota bacterium]
MRHSKAFTLIELLISLCVFAIIMVTLYSAFNTGVTGLGRIEANATALESGYFTLERIGKDLRNSFAYSSDDSRFSGDNAGLSFLTLGPQFSFIKYSLSGKVLLRLARVNQDALQNASGTKPKILARNVKQIKFTYIYLDPDSKELKETDAWNDTSALPVAVKVNLVLEGKRDAAFTRTIYLPLAK